MSIGLLAGVVAPVAAAPFPLSATLTGATEVPGPGDPDGTGAATVTVDPTAGTLCYTLTVAGIDTPTGAHIHEGATGVAGPIQVTLATPASGSSTGCAATSDYNVAELPDATARTAFLADLAANPQNYYVNVHNGTYTGGAVRGQLTRNPALCGTVTRDAAQVLSVAGTVVPASAISAEVSALLSAAATAGASVCVDVTYSPTGTILTAVNVDASFTLCARVTATGSGATRSFTVGGLAIPAAELSASETAALELALLNATNACVNLVIVDSTVTDVSGYVEVCVTVGAVTNASVTLDGVVVPFGTGTTIAQQIREGATLSVRVEVNEAAVTFSAITLSGCATRAAALPNTSVDGGTPASAVLIGIGMLFVLGGATLVVRRERSAA